MPSPQEELYAKDLLEIKRAQDRNWRKYLTHLRTMKPLWAASKAAFPGRDKVSIRRRKTHLLNEVRGHANLKKLQSRLEIPTKDHGKIEGLVRDSIAGLRSNRDTRKRLDTYGRNHYIQRTLGRGQDALSQLPSELRSFLPDNIFIEVDPNGRIKKVTDRFINQKETWEWKIQRIKLMIEKREKILKRMQTDLRSKDPDTRVKALIASILYQTGIRPGYVGGTSIERLPNGDKVEISTYGAATLKADHVKFFKNNVAEIEFVGKAATVNVAKLKDASVVKVLRKYVQKAGSGFALTTVSGEVVSSAELRSYVKTRFFGLYPKDFRRLKASEVMLETLNEENEAFLEEMTDFVGLAEEELKERVTAKLAEQINNAMEAASAALSHSSGVGVTRTNYIDPEILLHYFSTGRPAKTLAQAVMRNDITLRFDPEAFLPIIDRAASGIMLTLGDLIRQTEEEIESFEE
jgi:hypothetical protein